MTENYYLVQQLLPFYFSNPKNREFFYKVIGHSPENIKIFFEKEAYGWVKEDLFKMEQNDSTATVPAEEKVWKYNDIQSIQDVSDNKEWILIFVKFPVDFVSQDLDSISVAIAMKGNPEKELEIRLFMLEKGTSYDGSPVVYACERGIEKQEHRNLGQLQFNEKFMYNFRQKIVSYLENLN